MRNSVFPEKIHEYIKDLNFTKNTIGCSKAAVYYFSDNRKMLYLKVEKSNPEFEHEQKVMQWLQDKLPVPKIIAQCKEGDYDYLLMTEAVGEMACSKRNSSNPETLVRLLAEGIIMLQSVDISNCPFRQSLKSKLALSKQRIERIEIDMEDWEDTSLFNSPEKLLDYLVANQSQEELVFSHGDYCLPNIFLNNESVTGFIDLGRSGIADKWQDIALGVRSLERNLQSKEYTKLFFKYLNMEPDYEKIKYYLLLDELF